jgi:hypothetical protein
VWKHSRLPELPEQQSQVANRETNEGKQMALAITKIANGMKEESECKNDGLS